MRRLIAVENDSSLARDPDSNAILTVDINKLQQYRRQRALVQDKDEMINNLNERVSSLEQLVVSLINKEK